MTVEKIRELLDSSITEFIQMLEKSNLQFETDIPYSIEDDLEQGLDLISNAIYNSQIKKGE